MAHRRHQHQVDLARVDPGRGQRPACRLGGVVDDALVSAPATRRSRTPVRATIQSSLTPSRAAIGALSTHRLGHRDADRADGGLRAAPGSRRAGPRAGRVPASGMGGLRSSTAASTSSKARADHAGQRLAGPGLAEAVDAAGRAARAGLAPAHRAGPARSASCVADRGPARRERRRRAAREHRDRRSRELDLVERGAERRHRRRIAGEWKAPATARRIVRTPRAFASAAASSSAVSRGPATTSWVGPLSLATDDAARGGSRARLLGVAEQREHPAGRRRSAASCISRPRTTARRTASRRARARRAAASALSSPSECPARNVGVGRPARPRRRGSRRGSPAARRRCPRRRARRDRRRPRRATSSSSSGAWALDHLAHAGGLAALAGEEKRGRHRPILPRGRPRVKAPGASTPRPGGESGTAGGCPRGSGSAIRPSRWARLTASARLRTPSLR